MAVRKRILILIFLALLLISRFYLIHKYNEKTVEFSFSGQVSRADIEAIRKSLKSVANISHSKKQIPFILHFVGRYGKSKVIMTTGLDYLIKDIPLMGGRWVTFGNAREAVLGDRAADRFFRSADVVGQSLELYGKNYNIVGVLKNSSDIYISFDDYSRVNWSKKNIKFIIEDDKRLTLYIELLEGKLKAMGLEVTDTVVFKKEAALYLNLALGIILYILFTILIRQWKQCAEGMKSFAAGYGKERRTIEPVEYISVYRREAAGVLLRLLAVILLLLALFKCITWLQIPSDLIPANLFSPSSYLEVARVSFGSCINRLENGISDIVLEVYLINLLLLLYVGTAVVIATRAPVRKD